MDEIQSGTENFDCDVLVIGGGTAGPMAALKAKRKNPNANVVLLEKANVKRSGAISMGMDGLNNAVIPGHATPEQYTKEITIANDGIVDQKAVYGLRAGLLRDHPGARHASASGSRRTRTATTTCKKVHHIGTYVLPMPEWRHRQEGTLPPASRERGARSPTASWRRGCSPAKMAGLRARLRSTRRNADLSH